MNKNVYKLIILIYTFNALACSAHIANLDKRGIREFFAIRQFVSKESDELEIPWIFDRYLK